MYFKTELCFIFSFYCRIYRRKYLGVMVAGTWLGAFCSLIPTWQGKWGQFGLDRKVGSCSILPDKDSEFSTTHIHKMKFSPNVRPNSG